MLSYTRTQGGGGTPGGMGDTEGGGQSNKSPSLCPGAGLSKHSARTPKSTCTSSQAWQAHVPPARHSKHTCLQPGRASTCTSSQAGQAHVPQARQGKHMYLKPGRASTCTSSQAGQAHVPPARQGKHMYLQPGRASTIQRLEINMSQGKGEGQGQRYGAWRMLCGGTSLLLLFLEPGRGV